MRENIGIKDIAYSIADKVGLGKDNLKPVEVEEECEILSGSYNGTSVQYSYTPLPRDQIPKERTEGVDSLLVQTWALYHEMTSVTREEDGAQVVVSQSQTPDLSRLVQIHIPENNMQLYLDRLAQLPEKFKALHEKISQPLQSPTKTEGKSYRLASLPLLDFEGVEEIIYKILDL